MTQVQCQVGQSSDDAHHRLTNDWWSLTTSYLRIGYVSSTDKRYRVGMRFQNVQVPQGATITSAYLILKAYYTKSGTTVNCKLKGEKSANAATFSTSADFDARPRTDAYIEWNNIGAWTAGVEYQSPDISSIVQEIINQTGWQSGNSMVIFWDDDADTSSASREAYSYDGGASSAPKLVINYETAVLKEVSDAVNLGDSLLCNKTFTLADSIELAEMLLKNWSPQIIDSISLTELVEALKGIVVKYVADQISLADMAWVMKSFQIADSVSLLEVAQTPTRIIKVLEETRLADTAWLNKTLIITDQIALVEVAEKTVPGAVKTKLFIIVGDLAIQLT